MHGQTIALLEARLGGQLADLIARRGGRPLAAPALAEVPDVDDAFIGRFVQDLEESPARAAIFQTGVGTRALFAATDKLGLSEQWLSLLADMTVVARGAKPGGVLRSRGVRIDRTAGEPFTTEEVLQALQGVDLAGARVMVQRYGGPNEKLDAALRAAGATVIDIPTYRWTLPSDTTPLTGLLDALARSEVAAVVFTNAMQAHHLFEIAAGAGREAALKVDLGRTLVASIGPVCSAALREHGVVVGLEPQPPKLGPLVDALDAHFSAPR